MRIIGCDLHASQQTIAMLDRETGEVVEQTLKHEGETVREFYASHSAAGRGGHRSDRIDGLVSAVDGGAGDHVPGGASGDDSKGGDAPAETRSARCGAAAAVAGRGSVSGDLDAVDRAAGSAGVAAAPPSVGAHADARAERAAGDRAGVTACGAATRCGIATARRCSRRCRCRRTRRIAADELQALYQQLDAQVDRLDERVQQVADATAASRRR